MILALSLLVGCSDYGINEKTDVGGPSDTGLGECGLYLEPASSLTMREECIIEPQIGSWTPVIKWTSSAPGDSYTTPVVGNLDDDNGDGLVDDQDIPEVVVANGVGQVYVLNGTDGSLKWSGGSLGSEPQTPAIGDINGDGRPDIVAAGVYGVTAFAGDGTVIWSNSETATGGTTAQCGAVAIYDLEGDGQPEIVIGNLILDGLTGSRRGLGGYGAGSGHGWAAPMGVAADIDQDGVLEVVVGNALYDVNGNTIWANGQSDGFVAIGNFDSDDYGEIVVTNQGSLRLQNDDGSVIWTRSGLTGSTIGPPTVADFTGDGNPEIGVAGHNLYVVVDMNGNLLWQRTVQDQSSGFTGSSVFDFEGDGIAEVVYADEDNLWVFDGTNGEPRLMETRHSSATCSEYPAIADVDNDGHADIVFTHSAYSGSERGVSVIMDSNNSWQAARPVWNQHAYHVTNVDRDGTIPLLQDTNWLDMNTFRSGDMLAGQGGEFADLNVSIDDICETFCDEGRLFVTVRVGNQGVIAAQGAVLTIKAVVPDEHIEIYRDVTPPLPPGQLSATMELELDVTGLDVRALVVQIDGGTSGLPGLISECDEENNEDVLIQGICQ